MRELSIIIPVYNRGELIRYTLESVRRASRNLNVETIVVDDGSAPPAAETLHRLGFAPEKIICQPNQGLLFARLAGLREASGRCTLFLDSDDLIGPEKLSAQLRAMEQSGAEISYSDCARCALEGDYDSLVIVDDAPAGATDDPAEFFIAIQPPPHSPIWRTDFLRRAVEQAFIPPSPLYNSVAEIWFYHNASILPGRVVKVPGPHTIVGHHPGTRLTNQWEKLGVASLAVMEAFVRRCPHAPAAARARQLVAEKAFRSWRRLPRGFSREFCRRELDVWRRLRSETRSRRLGGPLFQKLARVFGPVAAGRMLRVRNGPYSACRTLEDEAVANLLQALPPP